MLRCTAEVSTLNLLEKHLDQAYSFNVDLRRDQLETRVATLELMLVTARARPKPHADEIAKLEQELKVATAALEKYNREHPRN